MITPDNLLIAINQLENSLLWWPYRYGELEPINGWNHDDFRDFSEGLYRLTHECYCMQVQQNAIQLLKYVTAYIEPLDRRELIRLTRHLLQTCDLEQLQTYRGISYDEDWLIRCLRVLHSRLIGAEYGQHPAIDIIDAQAIRFCKK